MIESNDDLRYTLNSQSGTKDSRFRSNTESGYQEHMIRSSSLENEIKLSSSEIVRDFRIDSNLSESILNSSNIFTPHQIHDDRFNKFARYGILDIANEHLSSKEYLFFSKPDLHIFNPDGYELYEPLKNVPFFQSAYEMYPESLLSLQQTFNDTKPTSYPNKFNVNSKFIHVLSNQVRSSLDLPGITATETTNNVNLYQINTSYRDGSEVSDGLFDFSLTFQDNKYLDVYMLFKAYDEYQRQEYIRDIRPVRTSYIDNKVYDKAISIWKIIVDSSNRIIFFAKVIGAFPLNVPRDGMSNFEGSIQETIQFKGTWVKDMNPTNLQELNHLTALSLGYDDTTLANLVKNNTVSNIIIPLYDSENHAPNTEWGSYPYIIRSGSRTASSEKEEDFFSLIWLR